MGNKVWRRVWPPAALFVAVVVLWQAACAMKLVDPWTLPSPLQVAATMHEESAMLLKHVAATLQLALTGIGIGVVTGVLVAIALHLLPIVRTAVTPFIIASQNMPFIAIAPLLMIWFGFGLTPKLILLTIVCFFPVAWSMLAGLGRAEPQLREYLAMIGASKMQILRRLEIPASLPFLFSGLKLTVTYSVTSAIVAEWLGASKGIGYYIVLKFKGYQTSAVIGAVICTVLLCFLLYGLAVLLEKRVVYWRGQVQQRRAGESE